MLEDECHLVFVLGISWDSSTLWDLVVSFSNFLISLGNRFFSSLNIRFNFLFSGGQLSILVLNFQSTLELIDLSELRKNGLRLLLELVDLGGIDLNLVVLLEHGFDLSLDALGLLLQVVLELVNSLLDSRKLGDGEGLSHFSLLGIPQSLIELLLESLNHLIVLGADVVHLLDLGHDKFVDSLIVLIDDSWELELIVIISHSDSRGTREEESQNHIFIHF